MTKYKPGAYDPSGVEYLKDAYVTSLTYYDSYGDDWDAPGVDFYGAGRDGYWYVKGVRAITPAAGGTFSDLHCWGKTGDPGLTGSLQSGYGSVSCSGNTATLTLVNGSDYNPKLGASITPSYRWFFPGSQEVDISVDWANFSQTGGEFYASLMIGQNEKNYEYITIYSGNYSSALFANGSYYALAAAGRAQTSGKIRFYKQFKSGDDVWWKSYYWNGSSWVVIFDTHYAGISVGTPHLGYSNPVTVGLYVWGNAGGAGSIDFSNFTINAGTPSNRPGWAHPVDSENNYCAGGEFPEKALIVGTSHHATLTAGDVNYFTIINKDTEEVFFRHNTKYGALSADFYEAPASRPVTGAQTLYEQAAMVNGELFVMGQANGNSTCAVYNLSFTKDFINIIKGETGVLGDGMTWGYNDNVAGGGIWNSLLHKSEYGNNSQFRMYNATHYYYGIATFEDSAYTYVAIATGWPSGGSDLVDIFRISKYTTYYPQFNTSLGVVATRAAGSCPSGFHLNAVPGSLILDTAHNLYCMAADYPLPAGPRIVRLTYAAYNAAWGSTFTATEHYSSASGAIAALSGTISLVSQLESLVILNDVLYYPADEGIYFVNWNVSIGLIYGKAGSGASYEILPSYNKITALSAVFSDNKNLLIATAVNGSNYYNFIINLDLNTLSSSTDITSDIITQPSAISSFGS
jgi:hypothetical protein